MARIRFFGVGIAAGGSGCPTEDGGSIVKDTAMLDLTIRYVSEHEGVVGNHCHKNVTHSYDRKSGRLAIPPS
jgi:hypothetical protein